MPTKRLWGSAASLPGSHSWGDTEVPFLLLQGEGTSHGASEAKGGMSHKALRIRGHDEHLVNVSSLNIHETRLLALCKYCPQPYVSPYPSQPGPETGLSVPIWVPHTL